MTKPANDARPAPWRRHLRASDLRGVAQLATRATTGVADIVEAVHQSVWRTMGVPGGARPGRTRGLTGLVYRSVHGITRLVGGGVDRALGALLPLLEGRTEASTPEREAVLAALNGVIGDRLFAMQSPFATPMTLRRQGLLLDAATLPTLADASPRILLMVHGLCMNDLQWQRDHPGGSHDHGRVLADALGSTPVYLRYNSGRHVSQNGRELAQRLQALVDAWPVPVADIAIVAHSMGGLVARSAVHAAREQGLGWPDRLRHLVFLGTPHHGAPLERAGHWVDLALGSNRWSAPFARLGQIRSAGITDLLHGHVRDEDWQGRDRFRHRADLRVPLPLPAGVGCHAIAASTASRRSTLADRLVGDGLVPLRSALGQHAQPRHRLRFVAQSRCIAYQTHHMALLARPELARQMLAWLSAPAVAQGADEAR